jgi:hypothetical protein
MAGPSPFQDLPLTARNRPGLPRIAYAGEDFHDLRERLLARMAEAFPQWNPGLAANSAQPDLGVVFIELFARMAAVLGAYTDARANEAYLGTAALPRSLIDLAQLIDYRLAPGASANAVQVFLAKEGKSGTVPAGYKVQAQAPAVVFETSAALEVSAARNRLRLRGFDRSERELRLDTASGARLDQSYLALKAAGQPVVFDDGTTRIALPVSSVTQSEGRTELHWSPGATSSTYAFGIADLAVRASPKQTMRLAAAAQAESLAAGTSAVRAASTSALAQGDVVLVTADAFTMAAGVTGVHGGFIGLSRSLPVALRRSSVRIYKATFTGKASASLAAGTDALWDGSFPSGMPQIGYYVILAHALGHELGLVTAKGLRGLRFTPAVPRELQAIDSGVDVYVVAPGEAASPVTVRPVVLEDLPGAYAIAGRTVLDLDRAYEELAPGVVLAAGDGQFLRAATVAACASADGKTRLTLQGELPRGMQVGRLALYGPFKIAARIEGYDKSQRVLAAGATQLELAGVGSGLAPGACLVVAGGGKSEAARVSLVSESSGSTLVSLARALEEAYPLADTVVYGNAVPVSHGAGAPEEVLGSGDPSQGAQRFLLQRSPLAYIPDPMAEGGVRAAVEVFVGDVRWTEVRTLASSSGSDPHYVLDIDEKERAFVQFGDGVFGAQPASGRNNIRARYRVGHGLAGNVEAGKVAQMPQPLPFLEATFNSAAGGGAERQSAPDARRSAAHRVRTLGRAVSLADYADLALTFGGIAKARADWAWEGGRRGILLTLAAAGGAAASVELKDAIYAFFAQRSADAGRLRIRDYRRVPVRLALEVSVRPNFLQADVLRRLWQALGAEVSEGVAGYFHFERRALGEDLFLSSVYRLVETTRGVEHALATEFRAEDLPLPDSGRFPPPADRIAIAPDALAVGGHPTDPAKGRLSLRLSGGIA